MDNLQKSITTGTFVLLASLALSPTATAVDAPDLPLAEVLDVDTSFEAAALCDYNPDAWVNACVTLHSATYNVYAYTVDTTPDYTQICVLGYTCYNVPVVLSLVDPHTYVVRYQYPTATYNVNTGQIVEDACDVIGLVCTAIGSLQTSSALPHDLEFVATADGNADGIDETGLFSLPSGELVALPFA